MPSAAPCATSGECGLSEHQGWPTSRFGVEAAAPSLGWKSGEFVTIYNDNRERANAAILETAFAQAVLKLALPWAGTASELHEVLESLVDDQIRRLRNWPKSGRAVSNALRRITPNLRAVGIIVDREREGHDRERIIEISRAQKNGKCPPPHRA